MSIAHLDIDTLSRGRGRNACATGAYISAGKLCDPRTGKVYNYTRKRGTLHTEIVLPTGFPVGAVQRQELWAAAELAEARKDSVVARQMIVALPHEVGDAARVDLVRKLAKIIAATHGVAVDFAVHAPPELGDVRNHHAHLLFSSRRAKFSDGVFSLGEKTRELDCKQTSSVAVQKFRTEWEQLVNTSLAAAGCAERIDMRSHAARTEERGGLVMAAKKHLGPAAHAAKRRGDCIAAARRNEEIEAARNALREVNRELQAMPSQPSPPSPSHGRARLAAPRPGNRPGAPRP